MIKEGYHLLVEGLKNINRRKLEFKIVEKMIKAHPIDLSEVASIGPDELSLTGDSENSVITISATLSLSFETSWRREMGVGRRWAQSAF